MGESYDYDYVEGSILVEVGSPEDGTEKEKPPKDFERDEEGYCVKSDSRASGAKRRKKGYYSYGKLCPNCGRVVATKLRRNPTSGRQIEVFHKHGKKKMPKPFASCAECGGPVYEADYLCEGCRNV